MLTVMGKMISRYLWIAIIIMYPTSTSPLIFLLIWILSSPKQHSFEQNDLNNYSLYSANWNCEWMNEFHSVDVVVCEPNLNNSVLSWTYTFSFTFFEFSALKRKEGLELRCCEDRKIFYYLFKFKKNYIYEILLF